MSVMFSYRCRCGISDYKKPFNAILLLKCICIYMRYINVFICAIKWVTLGLGLGGRLRGLQFKWLFNKMIKMHIRCKCLGLGVG